MKKSKKIIIKISVLACASLLSSQLFALPEGANFVDGSATIEQPDAKTLIITQSSDKLIINWQQFNIAADEFMRFIVPQSTSISLNQILGGGPSEILGILQSNGQVWLVNPQGITFGPNAQVNVASLIASTLHIQNADFMRGNYQFQGTDNMGKIINQGTITAADNGLIALLAPQIENKGILVANLGSVALGSGNRATLNIAGNQLLNFTVDDGSISDFYDTDGHRIAAIKNSGKIIANGGTVLLTAKNIDRVLNQSINTNGIIEANTVSTRQGKIILSGAGDTMVTGDAQINAKGVNSAEHGGDVQVLGNRVALTDRASINASGAAGGGSVLIGGDYKGANPEIQNAEATYIGPNTIVTANATQQGNGGKVIVWANGSTQFYGNIQAQGGPLGGNGGFVETSGKQFLDVAGGRVNTLAPLGRVGQWLLDPYNVQISNNATSNGAFASEVFTPSGDDSNVSINDILANLTTGDVTINTGSSGSQTGNITLVDPFTYNLAVDRTLTLDAAGTITIQNTVVDTAGDGALSLILTSGATAGTGISLQSDVGLEGTLQMSTANANIVQPSSLTALTVTGATTLNAGSGNITLNNVANNFSTLTASGAAVALKDTNGLDVSSLTASGNVNITVNAGGNNNTSFHMLGNINAGSNTVNITNLSTGVNPDDRPSIDLELGTLTAGNLNLTSNSSMINDATDSIINVAGTITFNASGTGNNITLDNSSNNFGTVVISGGNDVTLVDTNALTLGASTTTGLLSVTAGGALTQSGVVSTGGDITLQGASIANNAAMSQSAGNLTLTSTNGAISQGASGRIVTAGNSTYLSASGTGNNITLTNTDNDFGTIEAITNAGNISITDTNGLTIGGNITASGNISLRINAAGTSVAGQRTLAINNALNANSGAGNITLINSAADISADAITYSVALTGADITLTSQSGAISVQSAASITSTGTATITANDNVGDDVNDILMIGANNFNNLLIVNGDSITITDINGLTLTGITNATNEVTITANDVNSNTGVLTVSGNVGAGSNAVNLVNESTAIGAANAINLTGGTLTAGNINLTSSSGAINQTSGVISSSGTTTVNAEGAGTNNTITLNNSSNNFNILQVNNSIVGTPANVTISDINGLSLSTINANTLSVTANANTSNTGTLGVIGDIDANTITFNNNATDLVGGQFAILLESGVLTATNVNFTAVSGEMREDTGLIISSGTTTLTGSASTGVLTFNTNNDFNNLIATGSAMGFTDINDINIGAGGATGINANGALSISASGNITQSAPIIATGLTTLNNELSNITLTNANNEFTDIAATANNISITEKDDIGISDINVGGNLTILAEDGTITLNDGALPITFTGFGTQTATLVANYLTNNYAGGASPIDVGLGANSRWLFYLENLAGNTFGSGANTLASGNQAIWGTSYPSAISATGNRYVFVTPQTLAITPLSSPFDVEKTYGAVATLPTPTAAGATPNYQVSGFVDASTYNNAFTQDTVNNVAISGLSYNSAGSSATADVANSPYAITLTGSGSTATGYAVTKTNANYGSLTVNRAPLTITANNASRDVNTSNPAFTATYTGLQNGESSDVVTGLVITSPATISSPAGTYAIIPADGSAANYTISYVNGVLTVIADPSPTPTPQNTISTSVSTNPQINPALTTNAIEQIIFNLEPKPLDSNLSIDDTSQDGSDNGS
jgi:filamentous hemagglutinin family protein